MNRYNLILNILKESNILKLPESEINSITHNKVVPYIQKRIIPSMDDTIQVTWDRAYAPEEMSNVFVIPDYNNNTLSISVAFYYDNDDVAQARMHVDKKQVLINMAKANIADLEDTILHELTHAIDPKLQKKDVRAKINAKHVTNPETLPKDIATKSPEEQSRISKNVQKSVDAYNKNPYEFDSFTLPLITMLKRNSEDLPEENKAEYIKKIWLVVTDAAKMDVNSLWNKYYNDSVKYMFTRDWRNQVNAMGTIDANFYNALNLFGSWATKPTLYKRFYSRLVKYVPYK